MLYQSADTHKMQAPPSLIDKNVFRASQLPTIPKHILGISGSDLKRNFLGALETCVDTVVSMTRDNTPKPYRFSEDWVFVADECSVVSTDRIARKNTR